MMGPYDALTDPNLTGLGEKIALRMWSVETAIRVWPELDQTPGLLPICEAIYKFVKDGKIDRE